MQMLRYFQACLKFLEKNLVLWAPLRQLARTTCNAERQPVRVPEEIKFIWCHVQQVPESSLSSIYLCGRRARAKYKHIIIVPIENCHVVTKWLLGITKLKNMTWYLVMHSIQTATDLALYLQFCLQNRQSSLPPSSRTVLPPHLVSVWTIDLMDCSLVYFHEREIWGNQVQFVRDFSRWKVT